MMFNEGDIVEISLPDSRVAIGWIVYISNHFENVVGFVVFGIKDHLRNDDFEDCTSLSVAGPFYTHAGALSHYGLRRFSHKHISESKRQLTRRRVGGDVYVGDEYLGSVEEFAEQGLRPMLVMGMPTVYTEIVKAFGKKAE